MKQVCPVFRRELAGYFATPLAYVFLVIFLLMTGFLTFEFGHFYQRNQADLQVFFAYHPWLYLFLIPAISMRIWAEERKTGTMELLLTLPISTLEAVTGKFLAGWVFAGLALLLTFPLWITVNYLGHPDNGVIFAAYLGSWLMAGAFLAIGCCVSACTRNQVVAFILGVAVCFVFVFAGSTQLLDMFHQWTASAWVDVVAQLSFLTHFDAISRGVLDLRDLLFFIIMITAWLLATTLVIELKKAG